ncbi:hypothetical protein FRC12_023248 [Ceratobasidium sp. 428]|nr:hypothetical protein FRC12_023248 [Ceratobasidium sp. 428]
MDELLDGIPPPWNVGLVPLTPEDLPAPFHYALLDDDVAQKLAKQKGKDKSKAPNLTITNFRQQDRPHLKLSLEYMDTFVTTIHAFPDEEMRWAFASYSNYLASKYYRVSYCMTRDLEHSDCLLVSRISQARGKFITTPILYGCRSFYRSVNRDVGGNQIEAVKAWQKQVMHLIKSGAFLLPSDKLGLYYQLVVWPRNPDALLDQVNKQGIFGAALRPYPQGKHHLTVASSGLAAAATNNRKAIGKFLHKNFKLVFKSHLATLMQLFKSESAHDGLMAYLKGLHFEMTGGVRPATSQGSGLQLAIPLAAFNNYGAEPRRRAAAQGQITANAASSRPDEPNTPLLTSKILKHPGLSAEMKVKIMEMICAASAEANLPSQSMSNSACSSQQYQGLWTEVNGDSDDSEVQARRAGALPDICGQPGPFAEAEAKECDEEMVDHEGGKGGDGDNESKPESDVKVDANGDAAVEPRDDKMVLLEADTSDEEADVGDGLDNEHEPSKTLERPFFTADGGLAPGGSNSGDNDNDDEEEEEEESDGEGASGAVQTAADADKTMMTVADDDKEDD